MPAASGLRLMRNARPALFALAAVLPLLAPGRPNVAEARRFDPVLVTNMGQIKVSANVSDCLAQAFATGSNITGCTLTENQVASNEAQDDDLSMQVCGADSDEEPTSNCTALTAPDSFDRGRLTLPGRGVVSLRNCSRRPFRLLCDDDRIARRTLARCFCTALCALRLCIECYLILCIQVPMETYIKLGTGESRQRLLLITKVNGTIIKD